MCLKSDDQNPEPTSPQIIKQGKKKLSGNFELFKLVKTIQKEQFKKWRSYWKVRAENI